MKTNQPQPGDKVRIILANSTVVGVLASVTDGEVRTRWTNVARADVRAILPLDSPWDEREWFPICLPPCDCPPGRIWVTQSETGKLPAGHVMARDGGCAYVAHSQDAGVR